MTIACYLVTAMFDRIDKRAHAYLTIAVAYVSQLMLIRFYSVASRHVNMVDRYEVVQLLIKRALESDELCNELYMQLMKQTTENPGKPIFCFKCAFDSGVEVHQKIMHKCIIVKKSA